MHSVNFFKNKVTLFWLSVALSVKVTEMERIMVNWYTRVVNGLPYGVNPVGAWPGWPVGAPAPAL